MLKQAPFVTNAVFTSAPKHVSRKHVMQFHYLRFFSYFKTRFASGFIYIWFYEEEISLHKIVILITLEPKQIELELVV